ncbi:hypothetical protein H3C61_04335 [Candidatus Gracilibacteria bacterium]|nr:hypothetical protein [Candidatus Gracilibacteria bacterium]
MFKKSLLVATLLLSATVTSTYGAYEEVNCSSKAVYSEYSCTQCFNGGEVSKGTNISFLDDLWVNDTGVKKIMYKEEQTMPVMTALNGSEIKKSPNSDSFWEYTSEFNALLDNSLDGYVLPAGKTISWLKSAMGAGFMVDKTPAKGQDVGILVYDITSHNILESGEVATNNTPHKECVVYTSGENTVPPVVEQPKPEPKPVPEKMTEVKTGPEMYFLILLMAFALSLVVMNRKVILEKIKK